MAMGRRIQQRLDDLGWGQIDLLRKVPDMTPATLSALINRDSTRSQWSERIAEALSVSHRWLQTGDGPMALSGPDVVPFAPATRVPLLDWKTVADMHNNNLETPRDADEWVAALASRPARGAFAVRVDSDAMTAPPGSSPSFPRGTVLIVDPKREPRPGDFVLARDPQTGWPTFKRYVTDAGRALLVPLNPAYPSIALTDTDGAVIGVCCEWQTGGAL